MPLLRFRVAWEDDDQIYRDIELKTGQSFLEFHKIINVAFEFDAKHPATFFESDEKWDRGLAIDSEVLVNKKGAPALSMMRTPVSALVAKPDHKFIYEYRAKKTWTFLITMIGIKSEEDPNMTYPNVFRKEGVAPAQYGIKGVKMDKLTEIEDKYDLGSDAEGFGQEGDSSGGDAFDDTGGLLG